MQAALLTDEDGLLGVILAHDNRSYARRNSTQRYNAADDIAWPMCQNRTEKWKERTQADTDNSNAKGQIGGCLPDDTAQEGLPRLRYIHLRFQRLVRAIRTVIEHRTHSARQDAV